MNLTKYQNINNQILVSGHNIVPYMLNLTEYIQNSGIKIMPYPRVIFSSSNEYATDPFGRTAYYNPTDRTVTLFTAGRHIKDVLRSYAHELIHHNQNLSGMFDSSHINSLSDPQYAQHDKHLNNMELDAYSRGNMAFRAWEDSMK